MPHPITGYDHVALTVADLDVATEFYERILDAITVAQVPTEGPPLWRACRIGGAALNLHLAGNGLALVARQPTVGSGDLCLRWAGTADEARSHLLARGAEVIEGPIPRRGADGAPTRSVYTRDPDGNLIELMASASQMTCST